MMPFHEKIKAPLLACALAFLPLGAMAAGVGGHVGGGSFGAATTAPGTGLHPGPHPGNGLPTTTDVSSHARFVRPEPITGTRIVPPAMRASLPTPQGPHPIPGRDPASVTDRSGPIVPSSPGAVDPLPSKHPETGSN
ncbi:MAG TPA: hypothetical protein VG889_02720 [Rhizomicrobium sp.]|nr:hypothetical protein [Rhizomicrobium sp.]